jgi:excisionase family DNA binding protein
MENNDSDNVYVDPYYTVEEVAAMLKITRATVYKWMNEGKLNYIQLEGVRRISRDDLRAFIDIRRHATSVEEDRTNKRRLDLIAA